MSYSDFLCLPLVDSFSFTSSLHASNLTCTSFVTLLSSFIFSLLLLTLFSPSSFFLWLPQAWDVLVVTHMWMKVEGCAASKTTNSHHAPVQLIRFCSYPCGINKVMVILELEFDSSFWHGGQLRWSQPWWFDACEEWRCARSAMCKDESGHQLLAGDGTINTIEISASNLTALFYFKRRSQKSQYGWVILDHHQ